MDPDAEFFDTSIDHPSIPGEKISVRELTELRQQKFDRVRELQVFDSPVFEGNDFTIGLITIGLKSELAAAKLEVNAYSEALGLASAEYQVGNKYTDVVKLQAGYLGNSKTGQFDQIYSAKDISGNPVIITVESKGGISASYGSAQVGVDSNGMVESVQQCSIKYQNHTWDNMQEKYDEYIDRDDYLSGEMSEANRKIVIELGDTLKAYNAIETPPIYLGIEQRIDSVTGELGKTIVKLFETAP